MTSQAQGAEVGAAGVREGDVLAGKYRVDRVLGVGGMGVVVAAHHLRLDEKVAIKFLKPQAVAVPEAVARFEREARAAVKIKSEHVARVTDVGVLDDGSPYMVMEYLDGLDLSTWLATHGRLPVDQTAEFVLQACEAIAEAHALGIVHRDLKPANLFCIRRPDGALSIKVLDFGISKLTSMAPGGPGMSMTRTQAVMGSPLYMSPEQLESSKGVDARADIWALGIILYELLSGEVPFSSEMITEVVIRIVGTPTPPVRARRPDVPPGLEAIIYRCLEKDRDQRFQSVADLARALVEFAPPRAMLSLERIAGVTQGSLLPPMRASLPSAPRAAPTPPLAVTPHTLAMPGRDGGTASSWGPSGAVASHPPTPPRRSVVPIALGILAFVVVGGAVAAFAGRSWKAKASAAAASYAPPPPATSDGLPVTTPTSNETTTAPGSETASATPTASALATTLTVSTTATASQAPPATPPSRPQWPSPVRTTATAKAAYEKKPDCDPPYFVDSAGHRQYKKECF